MLEEEEREQQKRLLLNSTHKHHQNHYQLAGISFIMIILIVGKHHHYRLQTLLRLAWHIIPTNKTAQSSLSVSSCRWFAVVGCHLLPVSFVTLPLSLSPVAASLSVTGMLCGHLVILILMHLSPFFFFFFCNNLSLAWQCNETGRSSDSRSL